jgi:hypothetical protein
MNETTETGRDGTVLRAWTNDGSGVPVLLCNGLGAPPQAWPGLVAPDSGYRVVTWYQRDWAARSGRATGSGWGWRTTSTTLGR